MANTASLSLPLATYTYALTNLIMAHTCSMGATDSARTDTNTTAIARTSAKRIWRVAVCRSLAAQCYARSRTWTRTLSHSAQ